MFSSGGSAGGGSIHELPGIAALMQLPPWDGSNLSPLAVPEKILFQLGNPQDAVPTIHVAGTNGKGSVCTSLAAIAYASGKHVGQFASPHLNDVCERCLLNGVPVTPVVFDEALQRVFRVMEKQGLKSSYFVVGAVATLLVFAEAKVDLAVIEVGLGGRYDATNVMQSPEATVITGVSLDHTHILGDSIEKIAWNKAGIMKTDVPCFLGRLDTVSQSVCEQEAAEVSCSLSRYPEGEEDTISVDNPLFKSPHQRRNAALASRVASALGYSEECINRGLELARWPGRSERISTLRSGLATALNLRLKDATCQTADDAGVRLEFFLDAAHNPEGLESTLDYLLAVVRDEAFSRILLLSSILERKQWQVMRESLRSFVNALSAESCAVSLCFVKSSHAGSIDPGKLGPSAGERIFSSTEDALEFVLGETQRGDLVVCLGSIFFLADIRPTLGAPAFRTIAGESPENNLPYGK